jgi:melibiose permease
VDYGELKNGRRDESVIFSMQTFVVKLASGLAAFIASIALQVFSLSSEAASEAEQSMDFSAGVSAASKIGLRMTMTLIPAAGLLFAMFYFRKKFVLTDEKVDEIAAEIVRKKNKG